MSTVEVTIISPTKTPVTATTPQSPTVVEVQKGLKGTPASAFYHVGPTPPSDTTLIWFQTAS